MHSPEFDELCLLYKAREISPEDEARFLAHKEDCADCARLLAALAAGAKAAERAAVSLPEIAQDRLARRALGVESAAPARPPTRRFAAVLALAAGAAVAVYVADMGGPSAKDLVWTNGIHSDLARLDKELDGLQGDFTLSDTTEEIDSLLKSLEREDARFWEEGQFIGMRELPEEA